jgi:hemerythrin-like domain-containing protein
MKTITDLMVADHHRCDKLFSDTEALISDSCWDDAKGRFQELMDAMGHHFLMEEEVLFPAFEERAGQSKGPTQSMRMEHTQIRQLLGDLARAVEQHDREAYLSTSQSLRKFRHQHNVKEEQMLYRMADLSLALDVEKIIQRMQSV